MDKLYLFGAAAFEIPAIVTCARQGADSGSPFVQAIHHKQQCSQSFTHLWCFFLSILVVSRLALAFDVENRSLYLLVLFIHIFEAVLFAVEAYKIRDKRVVQNLYAIPASIVQAVGLLLGFLSRFQ